MGKFEWSPASIRWRLDAAEKSAYYREIARHIGERLPADAHVLDAGCGLGDLTLALAPMTAHVTAIDNEPQVISRLMERCHSDNVSAILTDVFQYIPPKPFDAMVLCFFAMPEEILQLSELTTGKVFVVNSAGEARTFSLDEKARRSYNIGGVEDVLDRAGIPYEKEVFSVENGQPFRSLEDAAAFFSFYGDRQVTTDEVMEKLESRDDPEFPYYYNKMREVGMILFENGRIPCSTSSRTLSAR